MKKILLSILLIAALAAPSMLSAQGMAWHLTQVQVKQIPDNYGGFTDTPDIYYVIKDGSTVLFTSNTIDDTDPPVLFYPNLTLDSTKTYILEVWDYDLLNADDELGQVTIPGKGSGNLFDSLPNATGRLELYYEFTFKTVGFEEEISIVEEFEVYPNPAQDFVNLRLTPQATDDFRFQIIDRDPTAVFCQQCHLAAMTLLAPNERAGHAIHFCNVRTARRRRMRIKEVMTGFVIAKTLNFLSQKIIQ